LQSGILIIEYSIEYRISEKQKRMGDFGRSSGLALAALEKAFSQTTHCSIGHRSYLTSREVDILECVVILGMASTWRSVRLSISECPSITHVIWRRWYGHENMFGAPTFLRRTKEVTHGPVLEPAFYHI
jgi:hypothetical protein